MKFNIGDLVRFEFCPLKQDDHSLYFDAATYETGYIVDLENVQGHTLYLVDYGQDMCWTHDAKMSLVEYDVF